MRALLLSAALAAALLGGPAPARPSGWSQAELGKEVTIPFVDVDNLYDFRADDERGIWLQDRSRRWYYARLLGPCLNLPFAVRVGVDTRFGGNQLDRTGSLLVDGQRCPLTSLTASNGPPPKAKKRAKPGSRS